MAVPLCFRINRRIDLEHADLEALFVEFFFSRGRPSYYTNTSDFFKGSTGCSGSRF